jgi:hypothetical protein
LCLVCIKTAFTTACGDTLSQLWTDFGLEEEYSEHYRLLHPQITVDKVDRARSAAEKTALKVDLRESIEPLMATFNLEPDRECSGCGGCGNCCVECVTKWRSMGSQQTRKDEMEAEASAAKETEEEEEEAEKGEQEGRVLCPSPLLVHGGGGQEEKKRKKKLWKKGKRAMMAASM